MHAQRFTVAAQVAADGTGTFFTPQLTGRVLQIHYIPDGATPYDNTVDITITAEATGQAILAKTDVAAAFVAAPRQPVVDQAGAAALYAAGGTALREPIVLAVDRVKIALAQGGVSKVGRFDILIG